VIQNLRLSRFVQAVNLSHTQKWFVNKFRHYNLDVTVAENNKQKDRLEKENALIEAGYNDSYKRTDEMAAELAAGIASKNEVD
jgi:hypothetical protein